VTARTVVIGTAGHIDHGKTTLLRALTGIDADRLPEERRRGMTIDVGYAHLDLDDGTSIDFVDVPGHDKLVGNMLVGAGEIDAAMVVIAADDGPRAQTLEHLELLDALGIRHGMAVITKTDAVDPERVETVRGAVRELLDRTTLAGSPVLAASGVTGDGVPGVRAALVELRDRAMPQPLARGVRLPIDRVFSVKGRGTVVTGTLKGVEVAPGADLVVEPGGVRVRVREVQVHGRSVERAMGGRTALLLAGADAAELRRGQVVGGGRPSSRILVALRPSLDLATSVLTPPPANGSRMQVHIGTDRASALVVRSPRESVSRPDGLVVAILRLDQPIAADARDRFALRDPGTGRATGGVVLWTDPPRGVSRRRATPDRLSALVDAVLTGASGRPDPWLELTGIRVAQDEVAFAADAQAALEALAQETVRAHHASDPGSPGAAQSAVGPVLQRAARRLATLDRRDAAAAADRLLGSMVARGLLAREGDRLRDPSRAAGPSSELRAAMDRLEAALAAPTPPSLAEAARAAGCSADGIRALEAEGRIVRLEDDLAWAASTYRELARTAVTMAARGPLTPAAYRDAIGSSRKYVMAILEDLDRRELLRRTDAGHVLGRRSLAKARPAAPVETP
jgi:selenocysteine-specific elongation factor